MSQLKFMARGSREKFREEEMKGKVSETREEIKKRLKQKGTKGIMSSKIKNEKI